MLFRKIRYWFRWRRISKDRKKLYSLSPEELRERIEGLFPDDEAPFIALAKTMSKVPPDNPEFKYFHSILGERKD